MIGFAPVNFGPEFRAGFTSRSGGVSVAPYDQLNLGAFVGDNPSAVVENRNRVIEFLGAPVFYATQVHGADVLSVTESSNSEPPISIGKGDAIISTEPVALGVLVADCVPVLFAAPGIIAVAHAGLRGVELDVVGGTVSALRASGARRGAISAAIGPAICGRCYEVPAAMRDKVASAVPSAWATSSWGTPSLDLPRAVEAQLAVHGVHVAYQSEVCTFENERFFSHRRAAVKGVTTGRQAGVIRLLNRTMPL